MLTRVGKMSLLSEMSKPEDHQGKTHRKITPDSHTRTAHILSVMSQCGCYFMVSDTLLVTE